MIKMDRPHRKTNKEKKAPRTPIKTYKWEDIRRARKKGGYPWTYLYKQPFNEKIDLEWYTMEGLRKAKSTSTMGDKSFLTISEITETDREGSLTPGVENIDCTLQIIDEPDDNTMKSSAANSVVIEECEVNEQENRKPDFLMDSGESSDNISQYLEKDESGPKKTENGETALKSDEVSGGMQVNEGNKKDDDISKRKRKLSAESSYSKISQTKSAIMKKIKDTKNKIKVPKISFPTRSKKPVPKKQKTTPPEIKKEINKTHVKNIKPVYIHIPLKPPPGQTDEFSYLEFEDTSAKVATKPVSKPGSFKDLVKSLKQLKENKPDTQSIQETPKDFKEKEETSAKILTENVVSIPEKSEETTENSNVINNKGTKDDDSSQSRESTVIINDSGTENAQVVQEQNKNIVIDTINEPEKIDILFPKIKMKQKKNISDGGLLNPKNQIVELSDEQQDSNRMDINDSGDSPDVREGMDTNDSGVLPDIREGNREDNDDKPEGLSTTTIENGRKTDVTQLRSKSVEPEKRRKLSIDSSYSRKSLSELKMVKKLKEAADKVKNIFHRSDSKKQRKLEEKRVKNEDKVEAKEETDKLKLSKTFKKDEPLYIHIPLKPPEEQIVDFTSLENHNNISKDEEKLSEDKLVYPLDNTSQSNDVQLIILTAPSDDEILDYHSSDVAETPSSETNTFFNDKNVDELKVIAKGAVHVMDHSKPNQILEPVTEESGSDRTSVEESTMKKIPEDIETTTDTKAEERNNKVVDIEDGLSETKSGENKGEFQQAITDEIEDGKGKTSETKFTLKGESSQLKKKVSFKRRSKTPKDGSYEDIQAPLSEVDTSLVLEPPSLSADTDTAKLDNKKDSEEWSIIKSNSRVIMESDKLAGRRTYNKKRRRVSAGSLKGQRSLSEGSKMHTRRRDNSKETSNTSSVTSLDVRCACQYFQCDSLLPDKSSLVGTRPGSAVHFRDHEYEPVNPPPDNSTITPAEATSVYIEDPDPDDSILPLGTVPFDKLIHSPPAKIVGETPKLDAQPYHDARGRTPPIVTFSPAEEIPAPPTPTEKIPKHGPNRFQMAFKKETDNIKNKLHNIKKPNIHLPKRPKLNKPKFPKLKIEKPKINWPKIPEPKMNLPSFSLPRKDTTNRPQKQRKLSTESNAGDSKKSLFSFNTYPRFFKRKSAVDNECKDVATVSRSSMRTDSNTVQTTSEWNGSDSIRIPLHSEDSMDDVEYRQEVSKIPKETYDEELNEIVEPSHIRYEEDIDNDDEFERENNEINSDKYFPDRWNHGQFNQDKNINNYKKSEKVTDLDSPEEMTNKAFDLNTNTRDNCSSGSSHGAQRSGVLEEINSDEFLWRQKGISEEDIDIRMYLSSEIKEAFKTPNNALTQIDDLEDRHQNLRGSNQSLPEASTKKRSIRKPKRKKTPQASQEQISINGDSADEEDEESSPPSRPRRHSRRSKKTKNSDGIIPYQETIAVDIDGTENFVPREILGGILGDDEGDEENIINENKMTKEGQDRLPFTGRYRPMEFTHEGLSQEVPRAPQRKHRSLKSLTSENDSYLDYLESDIIKTDSKMIIPIQSEPPRRPVRTRSRTSSESRGTSQKDAESLSRRTDSYTSERQIPCVEEPCFQDIRDCMGYAIIDKSRSRDPPLPPPRTLRRKRSLKANDDKFFTVPRSGNEHAPMRPLRNYSTLQQIKNARELDTYENKENIDITGYIEIEDEPNKDLLKGEVIKKMKDRPLPAPPRPPRKWRSEKEFNTQSGETETATQTEPLPDNFVCEEVIQEPTDIIIIPTKSMEQRPIAEKQLITPTVYNYEETITHGSLLVEPLNGARLLPDSQINEVPKEKVIIVTRESDETSSKLQMRPEDTSGDIVKTQKLLVTDLDVDTLTVNKLMADKIIVSEIDSNKISADEISSKSGALNVGDINLPPGVIEDIIKKLQSTKKDSSSEVEFDKQKKTSTKENTEIENSNSSPREYEISENLTSEINLQISGDCTQEQSSIPSSSRFHISPADNIIDEITIDPLTEILKEEGPPLPPSRESSELAPNPRNSPEEGNIDFSKSSVLEHSLEQEPEVDDEPPPRPPQPHIDYIPSQPPPSFYALRAQKYVDSLGEIIPTVPRRRRHTKSRPRSRSSSDNSSEATPASRHFHRRSSEPSLTQLSVQLATVCGSRVNNELRRLITYIIQNLLGNENGKQDLNVMIMIVLVLIAGLILLGYGEEKTVVHLHHWEYFNPPRDL